MSRRARVLRIGLACAALSVGCASTPSCVCGSTQRPAEAGVDAAAAPVASGGPRTDASLDAAEQPVGSAGQDDEALPPTARRLADAKNAEETVVSGDFVFWGQSVELLRVPRDGGRAEVIDRGDIHGLTTHDGGVYWLAGGFIRVLSAGAERHRDIFGARDLYTEGLAVDDAAIYWGNGPDRGYVAGMDKDSLRAWTVAHGDQELKVVGVDSTHVYFVSVHDRDLRTDLMRAPKQGWRKAELIRRDTFRANIVVGSDAIFFTDRESGAVERIPKAGGKGRALATGRDAPTAIALDKTHVYWCEAGGIARVRRSGGDVENVVASAGGVALTLDGADLFWITKTSVMSMRKPP